MIEGAFTVSHFPGAATTGEPCSTALVVRVYAARCILGNPGVQDVVGIPYNIDKPFFHPFKLGHDR